MERHRLKEEEKKQILRKIRAHQQAIRRAYLFKQAGLFESTPRPEKLPAVQLAFKQLKEIKEATIPIKFPEINNLHVEELPNLKSFFHGDTVECPSLEHVIVSYCPNIKKFGLGTIKNSQIKSAILENEAQVDIDTKIAHLFEFWDKFSTITEYNVANSVELSNAMDNLQPLHFTNLLLFMAKSCDERITKFLTILIMRSNMLQEISIEQCKTLEHLFDLRELTPDKEGHGKYFTRIKRLRLIELHHLTCIWNKDPTGIFSLRNLQIMHIKSCSSLENLFTPSAAERLQQLNELKLEECEMLETVVNSGTIKRIKFSSLSKVEFKSLSRLICFYLYHLEFPNLETLFIEKCPQLREFITGFATENALHTTDGKSFTNLNELKLDSCNKLVCVVSSLTLQEMGNLKKLNVSHCNTLETVFNIHSAISYHTELLQHLDELILINLPKLSRIINKEVVTFCQNLQILQVKQCKSLQLLQVPLMLTNMEILDCEALEKIRIIVNEEIRGKTNFSLLKFVFLENLTKLSSVFPSASKFPSLETLKITNCPGLTTFVEESNEPKGLQESAMSNYFFPHSLSLDILKVLHIINQDLVKLWHYKCPSKSFCELEDLTLSNNKKLLNVTSYMIKRFNNLKKLTLDKCELWTEVFNLQDDEPYIQEMLPQLRALTLSNLKSLTCIWNKELKVRFFSNLVSLSIVHCAIFKSLFSLSSASNLEKLKLLKLCNCEKIEQVIFDENENVSNIFPKMESIVLKNLPKFVGFCRQNGTFDWPNLETMRVNNIPLMKTFSGENLNTPRLRLVHITFVKKLWLGNLNKTISYIYKNSGEF